MKLVQITFFDHWSDDNGWVNIDEESSPDFEGLHAQSVGWIIAENDRFIKIAANLDGRPGEANNCFGIFTICKGDIIKMITLASE